MIYAPDGSAIETNRPEMHWPPEFMKMLAVFALACGEISLGVVCERCKQPLQGHNAREDNFWKMECACRKYVGRNPMSTAQRRGDA